VQVREGYFTIYTTRGVVDRIYGQYIDLEGVSLDLVPTVTYEEAKDLINTSTLSLINTTLMIYDRDTLAWVFACGTPTAYINSYYVDAHTGELI
jgi:hypothetical protein